MEHSRSGRVYIVQGSEQFSRQNVELEQLALGETHQQSRRALGDAVCPVKSLRADSLLFTFVIRKYEQREYYESIKK